MTAIERICPGRAPAPAHPREPHPQPVLPAERRAAANHPAAGGPRGADRHADPGDQGADRARRPRQCAAPARTARAPRRPARARGLRPLHDPAEQRPFCRGAGHPRGPERAVGAAAAARRVGGAAQVAPLRALRARRERVREAPRHRPVAHQPVPRPLRRGELQGEERRGLSRRERGGAAAADSRQVPRVRHQGGALRRDQGRRRHLRHGHHDGEEPRRRARPQPRRRKKMAVVKEGSRCTR